MFIVNDMDFHNPYDVISGALRPSCRIINEADFHRATVLIPFFELKGECHIMFEKRADHIRQGGEVSLPGGGIEECDADSEAAAVRETCEELGIPREKVDVAGFFGTFVGSMGVLIDAYIGYFHVDDISRLPFNRNEVEELFPLPFSFFLENEPREYTLDVTIRSVIHSENGDARVLFPAKELGLPTRYHSTWEGRSHKVHVYSTRPHTLWGITAKIMMSLAGWYRELLDASPGCQTGPP